MQTHEESTSSSLLTRGIQIGENEPKPQNKRNPETLLRKELKPKEGFQQHMFGSARLQGNCEAVQANQKYFTLFL
jgi:hypothetical protein